MAFRLFLPLLLLLFVFLYVAIFNPGEARLFYAPGKSIGLPFVALLMLSFLAGVLSLSLVHFFKWTGDFINELSNGLRRIRASIIESKFIKARRAAMDGDLEKALARVNKILRRRPGHVKALMLKGEVCRKMGRFDDAVRAHSNALSERPGDLEIIGQIGEDYRAGGNLAGALGIFEKVAARSRPGVEIQSAMRDVCLQLGDLGRAFLLQKEILAAPLDDAGRIAAQVKLAEILCLTGEQSAAYGKQEEALSSYEQAVKIQPDFTAAKILYAETLAGLGRKGEAEEALRKMFVETGSLLPVYKLEKLGMGGEHLCQWATDKRPEMSQSLRTITEMKAKFKCEACGAVEDEYYPQCASCGAWNSVIPVPM